jgi:hypothetical protein
LSVTPPANGQKVEYAISTNLTVNSWQEGLIFSGLTSNQQYLIFARSKENDDFFAGTTSAPLIVITATENSIRTEENETPLTVWLENGVLHIKGLTIGQPYRIFSISGTLVHQGIATADVETWNVLKHGTYIIQSEDKSVKIVK